MDWNALLPEANVGVEVPADIDVALQVAWNVERPDNGIGVGNLVGADVALHDGLECAAHEKTNIGKKTLWESTSLFTMDWIALRPEINLGVEVLADVGIALRDGLECAAT